MSTNMTPEEIERRSFEIIERELGHLAIPEEYAPVVKRVIHATADFDFARTLHFSPGAIGAVAAFGRGTHIVTDTRMAEAGINKTLLAARGIETHCLVADPAVAAAAAEQGTTRSRAAVDRAAALWPEAVYVVGNAPTALIRIHELIMAGTLRPALVVGVPVGFVNVVESKELFLNSVGGCAVPHILALGRKGGSTVAAAICNALLKIFHKPLDFQLSSE